MIDEYKEIYFQMLRIRECELEISRRYSEGKMRCPTHLSIGQEAVPAMLKPLLDNNDHAVSTHRGHAHYLAKGGSMNRLLAEIYGKETGCSKGKGGSMHLLDDSVGFKGTSAIVGNSIPIGVGLGLNKKISRQDGLSVVYFGDGATEEGVYSESLNFASLHSLPVVFVCENNLYSVYSSLSERRKKDFDITKYAEVYGIKSYKLDGNDVAKSYPLLKKAISEARREVSPIHLEFSTYRWLEHCGPNNDDDLGYRPEQEVSKWLDNDPIVNLENFLEKTIPEFNKYKKQVLEKVINEVELAFNFAEQSNYPDIKMAFKDEYA